MKAAADAGYEVTSIDVFADVDTQRVSEKTFKATYDNGGFVPNELETILRQLDTKQYIGAVYGSGFEAQPALLEILSQHLPLLGNRPIVVRNLKRARQFFMLLDALHIPHPEVSFVALEDANGWLQKHGGGSGGTHVVPAPAQQMPEKGHYFQKVVQGQPISMLFLADGQKIEVIGYNCQWVSPTEKQPFRYGGIVGNADLPLNIKLQMRLYALKLTAAIGLKGLNSLDAVMNASGLSILEVNPRLSSTFDLYQSNECNLLDLHIRAAGGQIKDLPPLVKFSKARKVLYANDDLAIPTDAKWPEWIADIPVSNSLIKKDNPVCTVLAQADNPTDAKQLVMERASLLEQTMSQFKHEVSKLAV